MKWVVLCSPVSGTGKGKETVEAELCPALEAKGVEYEVIYTEYKAHAVDLAKEHGEKPNTGLIAVGGDGTLHEVMDGLIAIGRLEKVPLGIVSMGTMNFYAISGDLPKPGSLADYLANVSLRKSSLMKITDNTGAVDTMCFEAVYIGVGYKPAKGAQEWRSSLGPMFGIMSNLIKACTWPETASVTGKLTLELPTGKKIVVEDTFFWIVVTMRSPYNGALTDSMWVSYLTLDSFPGFNRMMDSFTPPMECISGLVNLFDAHYEVRSFEWAQTEPANIGVCLDGDPTDAGSAMTASLMLGAWNVVAPPTYPTRVSEEHTKQGELTEGAAKWLAENPVPEGVFYPSPKPKPQQVGIFC